MLRAEPGHRANHLFSLFVEIFCGEIKRRGFLKLRGPFVFGCGFKRVCFQGVLDREGNAKSRVDFEDKQLGYR